MLQSQRANESEADVLAVGIAAAAGYDPEGLARYVGRVQEDPTSPAKSGFPPRDQRKQAIEQAIQALPARDYGEPGDFAGIQDELRHALPPPPKPPTLQPAATGTRPTLKRPAQ
jgi:hypothetical protein